MGALVCDFKRIMLGGAPDSLTNGTWSVLQSYEVHLPQGGGPGSMTPMPSPPKNLMWTEEFRAQRRQLLICALLGTNHCTVMILSDLQFILASDGTAVCSPKLRASALFSWKHNHTTREFNNSKGQQSRIFSLSLSLCHCISSLIRLMLAPAAAPWLGGCLS